MRGRRPGNGDDRRAPELTDALTRLELTGRIEEEQRLLLVYFWQPSCEPCRELRPQLDQLLLANPGLCRGVSVDVDREPEAAQDHGVVRTPTVAFFKKGRELHRFHGGALPASVRTMLK